MFVEIGLSLLHLFPHRVHISPLGGKKNMFLNALFFSEMLIKLLPDPTGSIFLQIGLSGRMLHFSGSLRSIFAFSLNCLH